MNRRDFFHPRRLARAAAELLDVAQELQSLGLEAESAAPEATLLQYSRQAMATSFEILLPFNTEHALEAADEALDEIDQLEDQLTVYRDTSEVSQLNGNAAERPIKVEEGLFELLCVADQISAETEGAFDISTGALTRAWGFFRRQGQVPAASELREVLLRVGMNKIALDTEEKTVRFLQPGLEINLGSIGKGYALDRAALLMHQRWNIRSALLHGGHSSVYALGSEPGTVGGWSVGIRHPWDQEKRLAIVRLRNRGLATSAATFQHLEYNGKKLGHILDPRTGWPAEEMASATVIAPTATQADALATAFFILGVEKTRQYCAAHPGIGAILLPQADSARPLIFGLSRDQVTLEARNP